jgi:hypothetical protein
VTTAVIAALALGLAATALSVTPATAQTPAAAPTVTTARRWPAVTFFTLNVAHTLSRSAAAADVRKALTLGNVGGFQEMSQQADRAELVRILRNHGWSWYMPRSGGIATPIVWNSRRFSLVDAATQKIYGFETGVTPARFIDRVRLRDLQTGKIFGVINTHAISEGSFGAQATSKHRDPRLRKHILALRDTMQLMFRRTENTVAMGDLNINYLADRRRKVAGFPTAVLGKLVSFDMPLAGSRGRTSLMDYLMTMKNGSGLHLLGSRIVHGFNSDHDAVVATYQPENLFATGPVFNNPHGDPGVRRRVLTRLTRAVQDTEPGSVIRLATAQLGDRYLADALVAAHQRGVQVRVILGDNRSTAAERRVAADLGSRLSGASWVHRCRAGCRVGNGAQHANFMVVSRSGVISNLTITSSGPAGPSSTQRWSDAYLASALKLYVGYRGLFGQMKDAKAGPDQVHRYGPFRAQFYPVPSARPDPVVHVLAPVRCRGSRSPRTKDGRTDVRAVMSAWSGPRGLAIARRLASLERAGCDVRAVYGAGTSKSVRKVLAGGRIGIRKARTGQSVLVVDGRFGRKRNRQLVWTGNAGWSEGARSSDGTTLEIHSAASAVAYLALFRRAWRQG